MQVLRAVFILAALAAAVGQYLQELRRLAVVRKLPGPEARRYYEAGRRRSERMMTVVSVLLGTAAAGLLIWSALESR